MTRNPFPNNPYQNFLNEIEGSNKSKEINGNKESESTKFGNFLAFGNNVLKWSCLVKNKEGLKQYKDLLQSELETVNELLKDSKFL